MTGLPKSLAGSKFIDNLSKRKPRQIQFGKLTWVGMILVALGWTILLSGVTLADIVSRVSGHVSPAVVSINMAVVAQCTILTGFGLAILGLLQTGFSTLNRFFDSVLERTSKLPVSEQVPMRAEPAQRRTEALAAVSKPVSAKAGSKIVERGLLKDRAYVRFGDGTIQVETLLGLRRFPSLREAVEFIG